LAQISFFSQRLEFFGSDQVSVFGIEQRTRLKNEIVCPAKIIISQSIWWTPLDLSADHNISTDRFMNQ
tara:strand:- start:120 stop:323 length:204 start_codon:yes stop_codon:yes gene_type:complete